MCTKIRIEKLKRRYEQAITVKDAFYEPDTMERLIIPVIKIAGWETDSIKPYFMRRGNRDNTSDNKQIFDLQLFVNDFKHPKFVFECKRLEEAIVIERKGAASNISDQKDFIRQIRNYCIDGKHNFKEGYSIPVLTNGFQWLIFAHEFLDSTRINENFSGANIKDFTLGNASLIDDDFEKEIITIFRNALRKTI